jgi:hypothetical protein
MRVAAESGFFGSIKVGKALSAIFIFILPVGNRFRNRLGKAAISSTVNYPNGSVTNLALSNSGLSCGGTQCRLHARCIVSKISST